MEAFLGVVAQTPTTTCTNLEFQPRPSTFCATHYQSPNMPPKGNKGQNKGKSGEEERDEPLQAVVGCAMYLAADCANVVDTRGPLRDTLQSLHTRAPKSTHAPRDCQLHADTC